MAKPLVEKGRVPGGVFVCVDAVSNRPFHLTKAGGRRQGAGGRFCNLYLAPFPCCEKCSLKPLLFRRVGIAHHKLIEKVQDVSIRLLELKKLTEQCQADIIFITAFLDRSTFRQFAPDIAWETEVWIADAPDHIIHFDGEKFLGPYSPNAN